MHLDEQNVETMRNALHDVEWEKEELRWGRKESDGEEMEKLGQDEEEEEEGRTNPHLAFSRRNDPTCLIFSDCLVGVWRVYGNCLECLAGVWRVS